MSSMTVQEVLDTFRLDPNTLWVEEDVLSIYEVKNNTFVGFLFTKPRICVSVGLTSIISREGAKALYVRYKLSREGF